MTTDYYHRPIAFSGIDGDENMGRLVGNPQFSHRTKHAGNLHKPSHSLTSNCTRHPEAYPVTAAVGINILQGGNSLQTFLIAN